MIEHYSPEIRTRVVNCSRLILDSGGTLDDAFHAAKRVGYAGSQEQLQTFLKEAGPIVRATNKRGRKKKTKAPAAQDIHSNGTDLSEGLKLGRKQEWAARISKYAEALEQRAKLQTQTLTAAEAQSKTAKRSQKNGSAEDEIQAQSEKIIAEAIQKLKALTEEHE